MLILSKDDILSCLTPIEIIEVLRQCFLDLGNGLYDVPKRIHLDQNGVTHLVMPALNQVYFCTKIVSVNPENVNLGLPLIHGTISLNSHKTGQTQAILDASSITALRTAAVGALGLELLSDTSLNHVGIIGLGVQGIWQTIFAHNIRRIKRVYIYARSKGSISNYQTIINQRIPDLDLVVCSNADEVVRQSEVIYTCTNSTSPVISNDPELVRSKSFISIGSYRKDMQELPAAVYKQSRQIFLDTVHAKTEVGDIINAIKNSWVLKKSIISLDQLYLKEENDVRPTDQCVFKSVGMAAFDLALSAAVYENVRNR